jgi:hypothetical protein
LGTEIPPKDLSMVRKLGKDGFEYVVCGRALMPAIDDSVLFMQSTITPGKMTIPTTEE